MLYLLRQEPGDKIFYLLSDKEYIFGRKNADIEFGEDQSISRKHAIINTKGNAITLCDCGSKYGTQHKGLKLTPKIDVTLSDNDLIRFGMYKNRYRLTKLPIVTTSSALSPEEKANLTTTLDQLGATLVSHWEESCTHITIEKIVLTIKVLQAIIDKKPIVTPKFWSEFLTSVKDRKPPPNALDFKPEIDENVINAGDIPEEADRRQLFSGKTFVFAFEKTRKKMGEVIRKTGGCSISWDRHQVSLLEVTKSKNYLFVREDAESNSQKGKPIPKALQDIWNHVEKLGERTIPLEEIVVAIIQNCCDKNCNPKFDRVSKVFNYVTPDTESRAVSLAQNTPSEYEFGNVDATTRELVIPESLEPEFEFLPPSRAAPPVQEVLPSTSKAVDAPKTADSTKRIPLSVAVPKATPSTSRSAQDSESDNPPKRIRLDPAASSGQKKTPENSSSGQKKPPENPSSGQKKTPENPFRASVEKEPETRKRKAEKVNPFAFLKRQKKDQDVVRVKEEDTAEDEDNPFLQILSRGSRVQQVETQEEVDVKIDTQNYNTLDYVPAYSSEVAWLSTTNTKSDLEVICKLENDVDEEFKEMYDMFRNTVIIETLPMNFVRHVTPFSTTISLDTSMERKNFKKFKKVQPRRPQTTILVTSFEDRAQPEEVTLQSDGEEENAVQEMPEVQTKKAKKKPSTFVFE